MTERLTLPTEREGVELRQLTTDHDDIAYFQAVDANRDHLSQFGDPTAQKYPTLEAVTDARLHAGDKLRMGIWATETFVGTINATPDGDEVEIGYWIDGRYIGNSFATLAARSLSRHLSPSYRRVFAEVAEGNDASATVLRRAGFTQTNTEPGLLTFELLKQEQLAHKISLDETERFERPGFTGNVYIPKEANSGVVALQVDVHGRHPRKRMLQGTTRTYYVVDGEGSFTLGDETHAVAKGDLFIIPPGGEYEYEGKMTLFEMNFSPNNSFRDEKLEQ
jgi:RimJ/RimL family protein N-acetyltransferase/mannose-6-phosphate isomerase-like protein (cupin superfamily)